MIAIQIVFGFFVGLCFGYILSKTGITKYNRVMGMLLLKDFKIMKFMLTAVTSSMVLFYLAGELGLIKFNPKSLDWGKLVGGLVFGGGMGMLGYCPGTLVARIGEGKIESLIAGFSMVVGIFIYVLTIKPVEKLFLATRINGNIAELTGIAHWILMLIVGMCFIGLIYFLNKKFNDDKEVF